MSSDTRAPRAIDRIHGTFVARAGGRRRASVLPALIAVALAACVGDEATESEIVDAMPPALRAATGPATSSEEPWAPGECDQVYEIRAHDPVGLDVPFTVPASGEYHPAMAVDPPWGNEAVQVVAWRPLTDNKRVLHHWILYQGSANLMGWSPGKVPISYPRDVGIDMPTKPGSLRLDMHYYNRGDAAPDRSGVALCVVRGANRRPKSAAKFGGFQATSRVMVPANARGHELKATCKVRAKEPITVLSVGPHAHLLARHAKLSVTKADGREIVLHDDSFAFEEQYNYPVEPAVIIEDGDVVTSTCTYDNETNKNVGFGESTNDEMCILWTEYYPKGAMRCESSRTTSTPAVAPIAVK